MVSMENGRWIKSNKWLKSSLVWLLVVNGTLVLALSQASMMGVGATVAVGLDVLFQLLRGICPVGAVILVHDLLLAERERGTLAWVLSAPVSRKSVILSKLGVNLLYTSSIIVVLQSVISQAVIQYLSGDNISFASYYLGVTHMALYIAFWVTYTIMLGVLLRGKIVVLSAALGTLFFYDTIANLAAKVIPFVPRLMPSNLSASAVMTASGGTASPSATIVAIGWIVCFTLASLLRFEKEEF